MRCFNELKFLELILLEIKIRVEIIVVEIKRLFERVEQMAEISRFLYDFVIKPSCLCLKNL